MLHNIPVELVHLICDYIFANNHAKSLVNLSCLNHIFRTIVHGTNALMGFAMVKNSIMYDTSLKCVKYYLKFRDYRPGGRCSYYYLLIKRILLRSCKNGNLDTIEWLQTKFQVITTGNTNNYDNHHIKPLYTLNLINKDYSINFEEIKKAFAPENHRLLTKKEHKKIHKDSLLLRG